MLSVEVRDGKVVVKTPYSPSFVEELKRRSRTRRWDRSLDAWVLDQSEESLAKELVDKYFSPMEPYLDFLGTKLSASGTRVEYTPCAFMAQFIDKLGVRTSGNSGVRVAESDDPKIVEFIKERQRELLSKAGEKRLYAVYFEGVDSSNYIVGFDRDGCWFSKSLLFEKVYLRRWGSHGSRRYPSFTGVAVISSAFQPELISSAFKDYAAAEDTPENRVAVVEAVKGSEKWEEIKAKVGELRGRPATESREPTLEELIAEKQLRIEELKKEIRREEEELKELLQRLETERLRQKMEDMKRKLTDAT
jgi:hypothetical protein